MKSIFLAFSLILSAFSGYSQQKKIKKTAPIPVSYNHIAKESQRIAKIKLKGNVYDVYQNNIKSLMSEQTPSDTLIEYDFTFEKTKLTVANIQKYATIKGKIAREGFYKVKGDTLILTVNYYDPYHGGALIESFVPDKNGWLKEVKSVMKPIDTDTVSERYIKTEKMSAPYLGH
jgi:hypothetical protein